jgi:hypothetical protein
VQASSGNHYCEYSDRANNRACTWILAACASFPVSALALWTAGINKNLRNRRDLASGSHKELTQLDRINRNHSFALPR